ncbi:hypothetical protein [Coprobacter sp.]
MNGKIVQPKDYQLYDRLLLSPREKEVLTLLAKGYSSSHSGRISLKYYIKVIDKSNQ